ncbi:MAG: hypothetical protein AB7N65_01400 [Vicinamibacterales bacterium]
MQTRGERARVRAVIPATLVVLLWSASAMTAEAQSGRRVPLEASVGAGAGALWDDETNLGRGVTTAGGVAALLGGKVRLGVDVDWTSHVRDSGYLRAEGDLVGLFVRASYLMRARDAAVRPVLGGSVGLLHSSGVLITPATVFGPGGPLGSVSEERRPWALTRPAFDLHGGVRLRLSDRLSLRPEGRWRATFGSAQSPSIEPPLINIQGLVHLDIRF